MSEQAKKRRPRGTGGMRFRTDPGRDGKPRNIWEAQVDLGKDREGRRQRRVLTAKTRSELQRKIDDLRARGGGTIRPRAKGTVGEWVTRWLEESVRPAKRPTTVDDYEGAWRHAEPYIGHLSLEKFDLEDVDRLYAALQAAGASANTVRRVGKVMATAFSAAIRRRAYPRANPFSIVERPTHRPAKSRVLDVEETRHFLELARGDRLFALWVLLVTAGLRVGEALGLRWTDIDFARKTVTIERAITQVRGRNVEGPVKTTGSGRTIAVSRVTLEALRERRAAADGEQHRSPLLFPATNGESMSLSNLRRRHFDPIRQKLAIPELRIHDLRHTTTALEIAGGVPAKVSSDRRGHSTVKLTLDRYGHTLSRADIAAADAIDALLKP